MSCSVWPRNFLRSRAGRTFEVSICLKQQCIKALRVWLSRCSLPLGGSPAAES